MFWAVRGTLKDTQEDISIVVEADSREEAEYMGRRRGIPVVIVEQATRDDIRDAKEARLLWKYTPEANLTCFGEPVHKYELLALMLCGVATIVLLLHKAHIPMLFMR